MLEVYTLEQSEKWDRIVRSFREYDVYWLSGYVKAFEIHGDGKPLLFYFEGDGTRGINVVMRRDVSRDERFRGKITENEYYDFATPYGYGGWIIEGKESDELFEEYIKWVKTYGIICEFVRFHPLIKNHLYVEEFYDVVRLGEVVHMELGSQELIWDNITSKNRNMIRKAEKSGVKVYNGRFPAIYSEFREIYNKTMDKDNAENYYYFSEEFYNSVLDDLPENAQLFWAEKGGMIIAASIMLMANGKMNYHLSGSLREYSTFAPTNLILYKAALWGCENGCNTFYLGGGVGSEEDSLFKFKRAFNKRDLNNFYIGKKVFQQETYDMLMSLRKSNELNMKYFPVYRS